MRSFVLNAHGRLFFPSNFFVELDFSAFETLEQFVAVIRRDFEAKAPTGTDILERVGAAGYRSRYELLRDLALNLFWVNRFSMTMYEKRPTRWRDVPRQRDDVFLPVLTPWEQGERKVAAVEAAYRVLPAAWDAEAEDRAFAILFDVFRYRRHHATELPPIKPTVAEVLADPATMTWQLPAYDPDYPTYSDGQIADCSHAVPELEALLRQSMVLHNQYPWNRARARLAPIGEVGDDDFVVLFAPRNRDVMDFIRRAKAGRPPRERPVPRPGRAPVAPLPPTTVRERFAVLPRVEALAAVKGEQACSNEDLIRNAACTWSPMSADEVRAKTGIDTRRYTDRNLEDIALEAAQRALAHAGREPEQIGALIFCSCTSTMLIPSVATWLSGQLGMLQTHASVDLVAACAGLPYGLSEAVRLLQEVQRPVLLVCGEKFSDKIGNVRTSRMLFGDGAAALVIGPAPEGAAPDIEVLQTYASGPMSEVASIMWPNPEFDNNITVYGPQVRRLAQRYLVQMIDELRDLSLLDSIELTVPHQANRTMVTELATAAGMAADQLYFDIDRVGNVSAASIPIALADAVRDGVVDRPTRVFAPGFGAGAVGGYAVMRFDPAVVAPDTDRADEPRAVAAAADGGSTEDVHQAFGG